VFVGVLAGCVGVSVGGTDVLVAGIVVGVLVAGALVFVGVFWTVVGVLVAGARVFVGVLVGVWLPGDVLVGVLVGVWLPGGVLVAVWFPGGVAVPMFVGVFWLLSRVGVGVPSISGLGTTDVCATSAGVVLGRTAIAVLMFGVAVDPPGRGVAVGVSRIRMLTGVVVGPLGGGGTTGRVGALLITISVGVRVDAIAVAVARSAAITRGMSCGRAAISSSRCQGE
jgi:hypothetical protein